MKSVVMKKRLLLILLTVIMATTVGAQDVAGKWYSIEKDGRFAEIVISRDSFKMRAVDFGFNPMGYEDVNEVHEGIFPAGNKVLIIFFNKETSKYSAITLFNINPKQTLEIAANGIKKPADNPNELIQLSKTDTTRLIPEMLIYSEHYVPYLKTLKNSDLMGVEDFRTLLRTFISRKSQFQNKEGYVNSVMTFRGMSRILVGMGYNPLIGMNKLNELFRKFSDDAEVKDLGSKLK